MLEFEPLTLNRMEELLPWYHTYGGGSCQHSFVSSFCMAGKYQDRVCLRDGYLYTWRSGLGENGNRIYLFPLGDMKDEDAVRTAINLLAEDAHTHGSPLRIETATEEAAALMERLFPGRFSITENRDLAEYIYSRERLAELPGHEMASKRHDLSTFERDYHGRYEVGTIRNREQLEEIRRFQTWWLHQKNKREEDVQLEKEHHAIMLGLDHFFDLGLSGIIVTIDGETAGYAYGAQLSDTCYDVMIEKGDPAFPDIYKILNRDLVVRCCDAYRWINREEDLGVEGLRKAKLSYKPDMLLKKYVIREVKEG